MEDKEKKKEEYLKKKRYAYQMSQIKEYNVPKEIELMEFLLTTLKDQSRNNVKTILSSHCVAVNGCSCSQFNYKLYRGDVVMISKKPFEGLQKAKPQDSKQSVKLDIIYEDKEFIVINKPSGLLSIESDKEKVDTAYKEVLEYLQKKDKTSRCFQVHRIDKNTSGVLLFCKDFKLKEVLRKEWNKLVSLREYIAVVEGVLENKEDTIRSYLKETDTNLMYTSRTKDGELAITHYKVIKENDIVTLNVEDPKELDIKGENIPLDIIFEDDDIVIVNKPKGMVVHPAPGNYEGTMVNALLYHCKELSDLNGYYRPGIVHRIDRPVSGVVLFARTSKALARLNEMFKNHTVTKIYWAITQDRPKEESAELRHYMSKNEEKNRANVSVSPRSGYKEAVLSYTLLASTPNINLLEVSLQTGRHHQIRAQLSRIGCPIRGDLKYGAKRSNEGGGINLHSRKLQFKHPVKDEMVTIVAPLPKDNVWSIAPAED